MALIKGITVILHEKTLAGINSLGEEIYTETAVPVDDVLVAPVSAEDQVNNHTVFGKHAVYQLAIPKGDKHNWLDAQIEIFGETFRSFGPYEQGIEENIPLRWNKKIKVEKYGE